MNFGKKVLLEMKIMIFLFSLIKISNRDIRIYFFYKKNNLKEMSRLFSDKLGFVVDIQKPYKFCDFRPAFGIVLMNI